MDLKDITGIGPATEEKLKDAGVTSVNDLAAADIDELAEHTGLSTSRLQDFQEQAREHPGGEAELAEAGTTEEPEEPTAPGTQQDPTEEVREAVEDLKVVLQDRAHSARVRLGESWHDNVPIVTAKINESAERKMQQLKDNVVLLKEKAQTAYVRIGDTWHENVPIFREREKAGGVVEETRVKVEEIREKPKDEQSFLDRVKGLFRR